ncbi:MAG: bile acid:sodium symporter family protein [Sedimentitalea sp.]
MDILINIVLPLALAFIMFSLGLGLRLDDFARVARQPLAFGLGALSQIIVLPIIAFAVATLFNLPAEIAVGVMILSFCPGGVTSNILSKLARGDVALSVSLTAVISLTSILTVPILAVWAVAHFLGENAPEVSVTGLAIAMFLITTLPVLIGVTLRHIADTTASKIEPWLARIATGLFILIVLAALAGNWSIFLENLASMGAALITLNITLLLIGLALAHLARLSWREKKTISIETGIQNSTLGITLAALISGVSDGFSTMALPSALYGITMYVVTLPFLAYFRRH